ncbi:MAG: NAD(P)-dependent oxidoreductase [Promethearchaeota archaeon]
MKVGFIGLGHMGRPMAENVLKKYPLVIYNRTKDKAKPLLDKGAIWADSPQKVADESDFVILMVTDDKVCTEVITGTTGITNTKNLKVTVVNTSTISPSKSREFFKLLTARHLRYVEAPVSGSTVPAKDGTLKILVAGEKKDFDYVQPVLSTMGDKIFYIGNIGKAAELKLLLNVNLAVMTAIFSETLTLGQSCGIPPATMLDIMNSTNIGNVISKGKGPNMIKGEYPTTSPYPHIIKDLTYALQLAESKKFSMPVASLVKDLYIKGLKQGLAEKDFSAILEVYLKGMAKSTTPP